MKWLIVIFGLLLVAGCAVDETVIRSEAAVEGQWILAKAELIDTTPTPAMLETWRKRIPIFILESRRRLAALMGEDFDLKAQLEKIRRNK